MLPPPSKFRVGDVTVISDAGLPGGMKRRGLQGELQRGRSYVYATPAQGFAQLALAYEAAEVGAHIHLFTAARAVPHENTAEAEKAGAIIHQVQHGYLNVVQRAARDFAGGVFGKGKLLPFGLDCNWFVDNLARAITNFGPAAWGAREVWCAAGSGTLCRAIRRAAPNVPIHAVRVGAAPDVPLSVHVHTAPEKYHQKAKEPPPFPSCVNYDAKVWQFITRHAKPGAVFFNVA